MTRTNLMPALLRQAALLGFMIVAAAAVEAGAPWQSHRSRWRRRAQPGRRSSRSQPHPAGHQCQPTVRFEPTADPPGRGWREWATAIITWWITSSSTLLIRRPSMPPRGASRPMAATSSAAMTKDAHGARWRACTASRCARSRWRPRIPASWSRGRWTACSAAATPARPGSVSRPPATPKSRTSNRWPSIRCTPRSFMPAPGTWRGRPWTAGAPGPPSKRA